MTTTLTDRYVWAVTRHLPADQRDDIAEELRGTVSDMTEAIDADADQAERLALEELGDPRRLAASYHDGPRHLIGPEVYESYVAVLRAALLWVPPIFAALNGFGELADGGGPQDAVVGALGAAIEAAVWVLAGVTATFAVIERSASAAAAVAETWTIDDLPEAPARAEERFSVGDAAFSLVATAATIAALFVQRTHFPVTTTDGDHIPLLQPSLWDGWMWGIIALLLTSMAVVALALHAQRWTLPLASANAVVNAVSLGVVAYLALDDRLINPDVLVALAERAEWDRVPTVNPWIVVALVGAVEIWDAVEVLRSARRADQAVGSS